MTKTINPLFIEDQPLTIYGKYKFFSCYHLFMNIDAPLLRLALYQPDIPQNVGAAIRLCACLDLGLDVIEPCGFPWDERKVRGAAMDYFDKLSPVRHSSWNTFRETYRDKGRVLLLTTQSDLSYSRMRFLPGDILLTGRESAGVPESVHDAADMRIGIPMAAGLRSLNVINAAAMVLGEALRQTRWNITPGSDK